MEADTDNTEESTPEPPQPTQHNRPKPLSVVAISEAGDNAADNNLDSQRNIAHRTMLLPQSPVAAPGDSPYKADGSADDDEANTSSGEVQHIVCMCVCARLYQLALHVARIRRLLSQFTRVTSNL